MGVMAKRSKTPPEGPEKGRRITPGWEGGGIKTIV